MTKYKPTRTKNGRPQKRLLVNCGRNGGNRRPKYLAVWWYDEL